jgi:K+/H+ antiporter YhaU regulatory subunit KhtT
VTAQRDGVNKRIDTRVPKIEMSALLLPTQSKQISQGKGIGTTTLKQNKYASVLKINKNKKWQKSYQQL